MARPSKRKASDIPSPSAFAGKKQGAPGSAKKKQKNESTGSSTRPSRTSLSAADAPRMTRSFSNGTLANDKPTKSSSKTKSKIESLSEKKAVGRPKKHHPQVSEASLREEDEPVDNEAHQSVKTPRHKMARGRPKKSIHQATKTLAVEDEEQMNEDNEATQTNVSVAIPSKKKNAKANANSEVLEESENEADADGRQYWLMKAEPESRIEKGKDVKFSIDDLKAATSPEPWDGVRNLEARNNMRAMTQGDLAFFYHSNCKVPGIVGVMEIVQEHSIDESAFDPEHPYYDEKSSRENPKWHLVHVAFRQKFPDIITLKDLQKFSKERGQLENMQTLKRSRLSVSKVSKKEWDFIMSLADIEDVAAPSAQHQPLMIANYSEATAKTDHTEDKMEAVTPDLEEKGSDLVTPASVPASNNVT